MALGIVRATDHGAIWREAVSLEDAAGDLQPPPTSTPPAGASSPAASPAGQSVVIPNSNKFKTPANGLKNLLSAQIQSPELSESHKNELSNWLQKPQSQSFAKTYFKPQYNDAIKAHLGDELHAHLLKHLPPEHAQALTTYAQAPPPKSNKFNTPANSLKKLLENPHTTADHLNQWMAKTTTNTTFAEKYLKNPAYQDALKGHLGEKNYTELQKHLNAGEAKPQTPPSVDITPDVHFPAPKKPLTKGDMPGVYKKPQFDILAPQSKSIGQQLKELYPEMKATPEAIDAKLEGKTPAQAKKLFDNTIAGYPDLAEGVQKIFDEAYPKGKKKPLPKPVLAPGLAKGDAGLQNVDSPAPVPGADNLDQKAALIAGIKKVFPNTPLNLYQMSVPELQKQIQTWQTNLDHPDHAPHVKALNDLYKQHFGPKGWSPSAPSPEQGQPQEPSDIPAWAAKHWGADAAKEWPAFSAWASTHGWAGGHGGKPSTWVDNWDNAPKQEWKQEYYGDQSQPSGLAEKLQQSAPQQLDKNGNPVQYHPLDALKAKNPGTSVNKVFNTPEFAQWYGQYQQEGGKPLSPLGLLSQYKKHKNNLEPADLGYGDEAYTQEEPHSVHPAAQEWINASGAGAALNHGGLKYVDMTPEQVQQSLQGVIDKGYGSNGAKAQELLDKYFGQNPSQQQGEPLDDWEQELLAQPTSPSKSTFKDLLNKHVDGGGFEGDTWTNPDKAEGAKAHIEGLIAHALPGSWAYQNKAGLQKVLDEYGPQGSDFAQDFKKAFPDATWNPDGWSPEVQKTKVEQLLEMYKPGGEFADPDHYKNLRKIYNTHFDNPAEIKNISDQMGGDPWGSDAPGSKPPVLNQDDEDPSWADDAEDPFDDEPDGTPSAWNPIKPKADPYSLIPTTDADKELFAQAWNATPGTHGSDQLPNWLSSSTDSWKSNASSFEKGQGSSLMQEVWKKYKELKGQQGGGVQAPINKEQLVTDLAGVWGISESNGFIQSVAQALDTDPEKAKALLVQKHKAWLQPNGGSNPTADKIQAVLDKYFGGGQPTPTGGFDAKSMAQDLSGVFGVGVDSLHADGHKYKDMDEATAKKQLADLIDIYGGSYKGGAGSSGPSLQEILDKHFGGQQQAAQPQQWTVGGQAPTKEQLESWGVDGSAVATYADNPEKFWDAYNTVHKALDQMGPEKFQQSGSYPASHSWNKIFKAMGVLPGGKVTLPPSAGKADISQLPQALKDAFAAGGHNVPDSQVQQWQEMAKGEPQKLLDYLKTMTEEHQGMSGLGSHNASSYGPHLQKVYDAYLGAGQTPITPTPNVDDVVKYMIDHGYADTSYGVSQAKSALGKSPEDFKAFLQSQMNDYGKETNAHQTYKALYDQYFGDTTQQGQTVDMDAIEKHLVANHNWTAGAPGIQYMKDALVAGGVEGLKTFLKNKVNFPSGLAGDTSADAGYKDLLNKLDQFTTGTQTPTGGSGWDWSKTPSAEELVKAGLSANTAKDIATQSPASFQANYQWAKDNPTLNSNWQAIAKYVDSQQGAVTPVLSHTDLVKKLIDEGKVPSHMSSVADQSLSDFQSNIDHVLSAKAEDGHSHDYWWNSDGTPKPGWGAIAEAWEKQKGGGAPAPTPPPTFDWSQFGPEFKAVWQGSGWATGSDPGAEEAKNKLKNQLAQAKSDYPDSEKTQKAQALWDKWFGGGGTPAPMGGTAAFNKDSFLAEYADIYGKSVENTKPYKEGFSNPKQFEELLEKQVAGFEGTIKGTKLKALQNKYFGAGVQNTVAPVPVAQEPEEDEGVSVPAKSEKPKAADVKNWAAHKPASPADWKNFAAYWGKTNLSSKQEQAIYQAWFNKETTPDSASNWFAKVYDYHSKPSSGDLGAQGVPAWAGASWALGTNAAEQWPVFQQWATKDAGIPKGLGVKAKMAIWNSLSGGDKKEIAENYLPQKPIDTNAVVSELQAAFPDSDFSKWGALGQGSLKTSVETLAKSGYDGAIPIYNTYFGGKIPVPEPKVEEDTPTTPTQAFNPVAVSQLPDWVKTKWGENESDAAHYSSAQHWADSIGKGDWFKTGVAPEGEGSKYDINYKYPHTLVKKYDALPPYLKDQIDTMGSTPWHDMDSFDQWVTAQPTPVQEVAAVYGGTMPPGSGYWDTDGPPAGYTYTSQKLQLGAMIEKEPDPQKKAALLGLYHKYFMGNKETLSQALSKVYPAPPTKGKDAAPDWDTYLKTHSTDDVTKLMKKLLKAEGDPERFVALADAWGKYFPNPSDSQHPAPSGIKQLTSALKYHNTGNPVPSDVLKQLHHWKAVKGGDPGSSLSTSWSLSDYDPGAYIKGKTGEPPGQHAAYHGWTPPGIASGAFKADPAMLMSSGPSYTAPQEGPKGKYVETLLDQVNKHKVSYSQPERATLGSEEFQAWFNNAPTGYKQVFQHNPGIALEDFQAFMGGGLPYGEVPGGDQPGSTKDKYYDLSPFALTPKKNQNKGKSKKIPENLTHNPPRPGGSDIKFPQYQDEQETLPLAPGEHWAPHYAPMPIYRLFDVALGANPEAPNFVPQKDRELWKQQQMARLRRIDEIINGTPVARNPKQDQKYFDNFAAGKGLNPKDKAELQQMLFSPEQLQMGADEQWKHFEDFSKKMKNQGINLPKEDIAELAQKLGVTPPIEAKGNYDHPDLANLLLDYVEGNRGWGEGESEYEPRQWGGLGTHWTRDKDKLYNGVGGVQGAPKNTASPTTIPVMISGLWGGQGEGKGAHGAYDVMNNSEREHNLYSGAPVHIRRLQIGDPNGDFHDLIDPGPMSLWSPGRDETASGKKVTDKPSLAVELQKVLGNHQDPEFFDQLTPGPQADMAFAKLVHDYPNQKAGLLKLYRDFFVGKPHLTTKPHVRRASVHNVLEERIEHLATSIFAPNPGPLQMAEELRKEDPRYDKRPQFYDNSEAQTKKYYSPHELNPPAPGDVRGATYFGEFGDTDDYLGGEDMPYFDRGGLPMYRGMMLDLRHPALAEIRRALLGPGGEDHGVHLGPRPDPGLFEQSKEDIHANPAGYDNTGLGSKILDHLSNSDQWKTEIHSQGGLGPHWTGVESVAKEFSGHPSTPWHLPVRIKAEWKGLGEDPYRSDTGGSFPEENEVTMLPGTGMNVTSVQVKHPKTKKWHEVLDAPSSRMAARKHGRQVMRQHDQFVDTIYQGI